VIRYVFVAAGFLAIGMILGRLELDAAEVTAAIVREVDERHALSPEQRFSIPIRYDATVTQPNADGELRTRFYTRSRSRK